MSKTGQDKPTFRFDLNFFDVRMKIIRERASPVCKGLVRK
jgi:hypothetical protein